MHTTVEDVVYATLAVVSNVNDDILDDNNSFCELSAYLEAAVEQLMDCVNGVVTAVTCIVTDILEEIDVITLKWVIEAIVAVAGNLTNTVSAILEYTVAVASEQVRNVDISAPLGGLRSALSGIFGTLTEVTGSLTAGISGIISAVDLKTTLSGVTDTVSSLLGGLGLTDITGLVGGIVGSLSGALGGLLNGITGTISSTLNGVVGGVVGGVLSSLNGITGGSTAVVSQLTNQVAGIANILSEVTLNVTQVITVVVSVIDNISTISNSLTGILKSLGSVGGGGFEILPCGF